MVIHWGKATFQISRNLSPTKWSFGWDISQLDSRYLLSFDTRNPWWFIAFRNH